jgi:hypothetical protein
MNLINDVNRYIAAGAVGVASLLLPLAGGAWAQESDPLLGYIIAADGRSWAMGGDLGMIRPPELTLPPGAGTGYRWGVSLSGMYSDYYRSGGMGEADASFKQGFSGGAFVRGSSQATMWDLRAHTGDRRWRINLVEERHDLVLGAGCSNWASAIEGKIAPGPLVLSAGLRADPDNEYEPVIAAGADFGRSGALGVTWTRRNLCPEIEMQWRGLPAGVLLTGLREELAGWMKSPALGPLHAELSLNRHRWLGRADRSLDVTLEPTGNETGYHGFISIVSGRWTGFAGARGQELDLMAYGMQGDYPYAKITECRLRSDALFASVRFRSPGRRSRYMAELERLNWSGRGRGHLEFWPFTSGFVDLLGLRRYFIATTRGHIWRLHLGGSGALGDRWRYTAGLNLLDVHPSAGTRHWRPAFLVFGVEDERRYDLGIKRLLAGILSLSMRYRMGHWEMEYSLSQVVPLAVKRHGQEEAGGSPEDPLSAGEGSTGYGGGFHRLGLRWFF